MVFFFYFRDHQFYVFTLYIATFMAVLIFIALIFDSTFLPTLHNGKKKPTVRNERNEFLEKMKNFSYQICNDVFNYTNEGATKMEKLFVRGSLPSHCVRRRYYFLQLHEFC